MEDDVRSFLQGLIQHLSQIKYVDPNDIPNINLYMDQVTTFMDEQLATSKRHEKDKLLTKTMINNYAKSDLLPPPEKKKYSREHILTLIFIYYFKNFLSISDTHAILSPITAKYFGNRDGFKMEDIYNEIFRLQHGETRTTLKDIAKKYTHSKDSFADFPEEDQEYLHTFAFICLLGYDIYMKKMVLEQLIDDMISDD